jgi:Peptidogalycan biosysnthesis/recognition
MPKTDKTQASDNVLQISDFSLSFHHSILDIADELPPQYDTFLEVEFLSSLEQKPPFGYTFCYVLIKKQDKVIGFFPFQIKHFKASESLNFNPKQSTISLFLKRKLAQIVEFKTLIVGSLLLTGEHSFYFEQSVLVEEKEKLIHASIGFAIDILGKKGVKIQSIFVKDFYAAQNYLNIEGYNQFQVEPHFIFTSQPSWTKFEDYLEALSSKYRVRAKRAFKKLSGLELKEFNEERIIANQLKINELYQNIRTKSSFNLVDLNETHFLQLKQNMGDAFHLFGYFKEEKLIGFFTLIETHTALEAHYLGYDESENTEHQLYLNMLFEMVRFGVNNQFKKINFGRTAHEIKSSIGAEGHEMYLYMKHKNYFINKSLPYLLKFLSPREAWVARQPFKLGEEA